MNEMTTDHSILILNTDIARTQSRDTNIGDERSLIMFFIPTFTANFMTFR